MATRDERNFFQRIREMGEEQVNRVLEELMSSPRFADVLGKTLHQAMATKGTVDRNMQTILSLLNLPSKADYKKLSTKIEALQGSLVNLNIKLDRILAQRNDKAKETMRSKPRPKPAAKPSASEASSA
jgi:polyhydroxyalkanoate synthesis regulator phasin